MTHNITSPVVCTMSMPDPRDSRYAQTPEVTNYTILALTCMRNKYLGSTDLPKLEDMKVIEAVVNSISDNLSITRPHKIGNIVFGLRPNFDPSMPLNHNQQRIHQLYQIIECASLTSVIWNYRNQPNLISGESEFLDDMLQYNGQFMNNPLSYYNWITQEDPLKLQGKVGENLLKVLIQDKAKVVLEDPSSLRDIGKVTYLNKILDLLPKSEQEDLNLRTVIDRSEWKKVASQGSILDRFLAIAPSEASPFETFGPNSFHGNGNPFTK